MRFFARPRSRSPAPLPKRCSTSITSQLQCCFQSSWLCRPRESVGTGHGLGHQELPRPVPPPQLRLSRVARALQAASTESQPSAAASGPSAPPAPAPEDSRAAESSSNSDDEWDALLDAHGLAGTAATVAQPAIAAGASRRARDKRRRRQRKAAKRSMWRDIYILSLPCPACFLPAWRRWLRVSSWVCAHFRGSCGSVCGRGLFLRFWRRSRAFSSGYFRRWSGRGGSLGDSEGLMELNKCFHVPSNCLRVVKLFMVASMLAKCFHRCRLCCSWTSSSCPWAWKRHVVS